MWFGESCKVEGCIEFNKLIDITVNCIDGGRVKLILCKKHHKVFKKALKKENKRLAK
jgi:hypothetical protein